VFQWLYFELIHKKIEAYFFVENFCDLQKFIF
jgi:hypothetical protein